MSHFAPLTLPSSVAPGTRVRFAHNPCGRVFVFVHGFNGSSKGTWVDFPSLTPERSKCGGADLVFYEYDSLKTQPGISGGLLRSFLRNLWDNPTAISNAVLDPTVHRPASFRYTNITLVGHSLGAVISRLAVIDGLRGMPHPDSWVKDAKLLLFAPAHKGAAITQLAVECLSGLPVIGAYLSPIFPLLKSRYPVLRALEPESEVLRDLEAWTTKLLPLAGGGVLRASVVWGSKDNVVENLVFADDPPSAIVQEKGHIDVCKPSRAFTRPLEILESLQ